MDIHFLKLNEDPQVTSEMWYVFCKLAYNALTCTEMPVGALRDDGRLVSNLTLEDLAADMNMSTAQVRILIQKLLQLKWIGVTERPKGYWEMGEIKLKQPRWKAQGAVSLPVLLPPEKKNDAVAQLRAVIAAREKKRAIESVTKVSPQVRMQALAHIRKQKTSKSPAVRILSHAQEKHLTIFGSEYTISIDRNGKPCFPKEMGQINTFLSYCSNEEPLARNMITWLFDNWTKIIAQTEWIGAFHIGMLSSAKSFKVFQRMYAAEVHNRDIRVAGVADRYNAAAAADLPDEGF